MIKAGFFTPIRIALLVLAGMLLHFFSFISSSSFYSDIKGLLPSTHSLELIHQFQQSDTQQFQQRLLIAIKPSGKVSQNDIVELKQAIQSSPFFNINTDDHDALLSWYERYGHNQLTTSQRMHLQNSSTEQLTKQGVALWVSPSQRPLLPFNRDPFALHKEWLQAYSPPHIQWQPNVQLALVTASSSRQSEQWYIISAELTTSPYNLKAQQQLQEILEQLPLTLNDNLLVSGLIFHAHEGALIAQQEITTVGSISMVVIILLTLWAFRSLTPLFFVLSTLALACFSATYITLLVFSSIHWMTLAFGSTLLGVSVDYCYHALIKQGQQQNHQSLLKALTFAALSSCLAYSAQAVSQFPAFQQIACFMSVGLLTTLLVVTLYCTYYSNTPNTEINQSKSAPLIIQNEGIASLFNRLNQHYSLNASRAMKVISILTTLLVGLIIYSMASPILASLNNSSSKPNSQSAAALRSINTSSAALLNSERHLQQIMQQPSSSQYIVVYADTPDQLLQYLEQQEQQLLPLLESGVINRYQSATHYLSSNQNTQQQQDVLYRRLYDKGAAFDQLCAQLNIPCDSLPRDFITPKTNALHESIITVFNQLPIPHKIREENGQFFSRITLSQGNTYEPARIKAQLISSAKWVDSAQAYGWELQHLKHVALVYLLFAMLGLYALLWYLYRSNNHKIALLLVFTGSFALGVSHLFQDISVFHILALLLVLGISLDTAFIYQETGFKRPTWLACSLSCLTTLFAFGVLAFSQVPILQQFGTTVFLGLITLWLASPYFFAKEFSEDSSTNSLLINSTINE